MRWQSATSFLLILASSLFVACGQSNGPVFNRYYAYSSLSGCDEELRANNTIVDMYCIEKESLEREAFSFTPRLGALSSKYDIRQSLAAAKAARKLSQKYHEAGNEEYYLLLLAHAAMLLSMGPETDTALNYFEELFRGFEPYSSWETGKPAYAIALLYRAHLLDRLNRRKQAAQDYCLYTETFSNLSVNEQKLFQSFEIKKLFDPDLARERCKEASNDVE